jgi:hypothetical protein
VRVKDAAFVLTSFADFGMRQRLTKALVDWYVVDFEVRSLTGNYSAEQVVRQLGAPAAAVLVEALSARLPQQALIKLAELIAQLGNPAAKHNAASRIVEIEREMEGEGFRVWLQGGIRAQMQHGGTPLDEVHLLRAVERNQQKFIGEGALPAMKYLADQSEVAGRLLQIASTASVDPKPIEQRVKALSGLKEEERAKLRQQLLDSASAGLVERRIGALQALEGNVNKEHLQTLLSLALDASNSASVRDYAFDRVGDIRSPEAIPPMWPLVQDDKRQRSRWRAGELVLAIGGNKVLAEFFEKLPAGKEVAYEPEELEGYASRMSQMDPLPRKVAVARLESQRWWDRIIGIDFLERRGTAADLEVLKRMVNDDTPVEGKGWAEGDTVGKVAQRALASLQERLKETSGQSVDGARR